MAGLADVADPVLVLVNRDAAAAVRLGGVTLTELDDVPARDPSWDGAARPATSPSISRRRNGSIGSAATRRVRGDALALAENLVRYLSYRGASSVVLPEALSDRLRRRAPDGPGR